MPAFVEPLRRLIAQGHEVDFVVAVPDARTPLNVQVEWLRGCTIHQVSWSPRGWRRVVSPVALYRRVRQVLRDREYDLVYGHGRLAAVACVVARRSGVACGVRVYGTFLARPLSQLPLWKVAMRHPLEVMSFTTDKDFIIVTNDGTRGDQVYRRLVEDRSEEFHFLLNGVDNCAPADSVDHSGAVSRAGRYLLYPGRISPWKRQHLGVEVLSELHRLGHTDVSLLFAGHLSDPEYWAEIQQLCATRGLGGHVVHLGSLDRNALTSYYRSALAVLSMYDVSNLGNVVIEALSSGAAIIASDDGSLDGIVVHGESGFLVTNPSEAAGHVHDLIVHPETRSSVRDRARIQAMHLFKSWEERSRIELGILERATGKRRMPGRARSSGSTPLRASVEG
jgi:glycosyltransferase involved in cell wall biosynthesis